MSKISTLPYSRRQLIPISILTLLAIFILLISGSGSNLACDSGVECIIQRRTLFSNSSGRFRWSEIKYIRMTGTSGKSTSSGGYNRGASGENWELETVSGNKIPVFNGSVAWPFGTLSRQFLQTRINSAIQGKLWSVSLGGVSWFISFVLGAIAVILFLMQIVRKIEPGMSPENLSVARKTNLLRFLILLIGSTAFWALVLASMIYWFSSAGFP